MRSFVERTANMDDLLEAIAALDTEWVTRKQLTEKLGKPGLNAQEQAFLGAMVELGKIRARRVEAGAGGMRFEYALPKGTKAPDPLESAAVFRNVRLLENVLMETNRLARNVSIFAPLGDSRALRLLCQGMHDHLVGRLSELYDGLAAVGLADDPYFTLNRDLVLDVARAALAVEQGRDDGAKLIEVIRANYPDFWEHGRTLAGWIDLGGRPRDPDVEALRALGVPLYLEYGAKWAKIAQDLHYRATLEADNPDLDFLRRRWKDKDRTARRKDVRNALKNSV